MNQKPTNRCSSLPILERCLGMTGAPIRIGTASEIADVGTDVHTFGASLARDGQAEYEGNDAEMGFLTGQLRRAWEGRFKDEFPNPQVEKYLEADLPQFILSGHPDCYSVQGTHAAILDWKSGHNTDADVRGQLLGYAYLVMEAHPAVAEVDLYAVWLREANITHWPFTRAQVIEWIRGVNRRVARWDGTSFTAGPHCQYCPRFHDCPARTMRAHSAIRDLAAFDPAGMDRAELAARIPAFHEGVKMIEKQCEAYRAWVKQDLRENGPLGDGETELCLYNQRDTTIDPQIAWPILQDALRKKLPDEDSVRDTMSGFIKFQKGKIMEAITELSAAREKGKDKKMLMLQLEEAGALTVTHTQVLQTRKVKHDDPDTHADTPG